MITDAERTCRDMQLEHGKKARVGNYEVLKYSKSLSKKELKQLREGVTDELPAAVKECLQRGSLSYIKVSTISGSWSVEFVVGTTMYDAINEIPVAQDSEGNITYYGTQYSNLHATINAWLADTTTVGDFEYQKAKQEALSEYLKRAAKVKATKENEKSDEERIKESDDAVQEVIDKYTHAAKILEMGEYIRKEGIDNEPSD